MNVVVHNHLEDPGSLCITCIFISGTQLKNASCYIQVTETGGFSANAKAIQEEGSSNGSVCTSNLPTGVYTISVCGDPFCNHSSPSEELFLYHNLAVIGYDIGNMLLLSLYIKYKVFVARHCVL